MNKEVLSELNNLDQLIDNFENSALEIKKIIPILRVVYEAVNSTIGGILITDGEGEILYANPSFLKMFSYRNIQALQKNKLGDLFADKEITTLFDVKKIIDSGSNGNSEFSVITKYGKNIDMEVKCSDIMRGNKVIGRMGSFYNISKRKKLEREKEKLTEELQNALAQVKTLKGLVPICSYCKNIRDDKGFWNQLEAYISEHTEAKFSHGICPECIKEHFPEYYT